MFTCPNCGAQLDENANPNIKPLTMWGYFGYQILFGIPVIGLIMLFVFSFGGTANVNLRNFARSYFCYLIVVVIVTAILAAILVPIIVASGFGNQ